jgi:hypothetical protein
LLCLQPLSAIHPEKERSDGLNIERFIRIYQKEKEKRGDQERKSWCKKKKWEKIGQLTKFGER